MTKVAKEEEESKQKTNYIELRIPNPGPLAKLLGLLLLLTAAFLLGTIYDKLTHETTLPPTSATGAFISYAKQLNLDTNKFQSCLQSQKYNTSITADMDAGRQASVSATPSFFVNGIPLIGALPYQDFKTLIDQQLNGTGKQANMLIFQAAAQEISPTISPSQVPTPINVATGHLPILGNEKAKVTIVEFSDFQCPYCKRFADNSLSQIKKDYIDTGKVKLYYREFPLTNIHPNAEIAAEAAECANEQGKFWQFHDQLFSRQDTWSTLPAQPVSTQ